jgi:hypothetical protein
MNEEEQKPDVSEFKSAKVHVLDGLPEYLKDPKNYEKIQRDLLDTLASSHSHGEMIEWASCYHCQIKFAQHAEAVRLLGFRSPAQYFAWKKVHAQIKRRVPLAYYND